MPATKGSKKDSVRAITPVAEAVHVPAHLAPPVSPLARQLRHLHSQLSLGQSCHRQEKSCSYTRRVTSVVSDSLRPSRLWPARLLCQGGGFSRQGYWSILANTGCHTFLEHYISCYSSSQPTQYLNPCNSSSCITSRGKPHRGKQALTGANPSPPGQPQEHTPVDDPSTEVEIKPQLKPRGSVAK